MIYIFKEEVNFKAKGVVDNLQSLVTDITQRQVGHEMQSQIFRYEGYKGLAKRYEEHAEMESYFIKKFIYRILYWGVVVKNEKKEAIEIFKDPVECIKNDFNVTRKEFLWIREIFDSFRSYDMTSYELLKKYFIYEEKIMHWFEKQLEYIEKIGLKNYLTYRIDVNDNPSLKTI